MANITKITASDGTTYNIKDNVSGYVTTDEKVTQTEVTSGNNYEVIVSGTASTATKTEGVGKSAGFQYNPSKKAITVGVRNSSTVIGNYSSVFGEVCEASGTHSHAEGSNSVASGAYSHVEGYATTASEAGAHAEGYLTKASGAQSHAEGCNTLASEDYTHTEGIRTVASGYCSHAEGCRTVASQYYSHAEGYSTTASGNVAHAEGSCTIANHKSQHVFGEYNLLDASTAAATARGNYVEIVGNGLSSTQLSNARTLDWDGNEWLAGGLESSYFVANRTPSSDRSDTTEIAGGYAHFINRYDSGTRVYQMSLSGIDIELNNSTWDGTNTSLKDSLAAKLSLDGGTMTGSITTETGKWYTQGNYSLHLNNSDIIGVNGMWFNNVCSDGGEGIMFPRTNGNWDDLYSVDGSLYYCVDRATAGSRGSAYTILHTGNGVLSVGGKYTGGAKPAGFCLHGVGAGHTYACEWGGSNLAFWVDLTKVATVSDRRLKDDIEEVNWNLVRAIAECKTYQYKAFNRNGLISVGIIAQDLVANCEKYGVDPLEYELMTKEEFIDGDPTLYYHIEYDQYLTFKSLWLQHQIDELKELIQSK